MLESKNCGRQYGRTVFLAGPASSLETIVAQTERPFRTTTEQKVVNITGCDVINEQSLHSTVVSCGRCQKVCVLLSDEHVCGAEDSSPQSAADWLRIWPRIGRIPENLV